MLLIGEINKCEFQTTKLWRYKKVESKKICGTQVGKNMCKN